MTYVLRTSFCRLSLIAVILTISIIGCGQLTPPTKVETPSTSKLSAPVQTREVAIAAAADLKFALDELLAEFARQHPEIQTKVTYGSSGNFFAQLSNKAPFELYLSADIDYPRKLVEQELAIADSQFSYAIGHVVVWVPKDSPLKVEESGLTTLLDPAIQKIAIANPKHAPYGRAAVASLKSSEIYEKIEDKLVLAENIAQAAQFIETGAADIGIISLSLAMAPTLREKGRSWQIPATAHPPIEQAGVILSWAKDVEAAKEVRAYLMSAAGQDIMKKYGFEAPAAREQPRACDTGWPERVGNLITNAGDSPKQGGFCCPCAGLKPSSIHFLPAWNGSSTGL